MRKEIPRLSVVSSKGQLVIPQKVREELKIGKGSVFAITTKKDLMVLKKIRTKMTKEDLKTLKSVEEAWKEIEEGKYKRLPTREFFKELEKW